ncbi:hypothetical protein K438DRAFT_1853186, partial [Mycena galopus ATCC 62051]
TKVRLSQILCLGVFWLGEQMRPLSRCEDAALQTSEALKMDRHVRQPVQTIPFPLIRIWWRPMFRGSANSIIVGVRNRPSYLKADSQYWDLG